MKILNTTTVVTHWQNVQHKKPLVHCLTNFVAMQWTANVLIAHHMSPAMVIAVEEVADFAHMADSLLINIGTLTASSQNAMLAAVTAYRALNKPWVLDPVAAYPALQWRYEFCQQLLALKPTVIRGNASEIQALTQQTTASKGVDSVSASHTAISAAQALARETGAIVVVTGAEDYITDGHQTLCIPIDVVELTTITATGCALSALIAGYLAASTPNDYFSATASACGLMKISGQAAKEKSNGPGSLAMHLLDALQCIDPSYLTNAIWES